MQQSIHFLSFAVAMSILSLNAPAAEVWNYKFIVNGSRPYRGDCDCATPMYADVAGSFSILLDWQKGTGKLLQLNDHLTNVAFGSYTPGGLIMTPANLPELDRGIIPPYYTSPLPVGHFGYPNGVGRLVSDPDLGESYDITFGLHSASLNLNLYIDDGGIAVTNAAAIFASASIAGDHNDDWRVDGSDYVALRNNGGSPFDYNLWRTYFGTDASVTTITTANGVPEPSVVLLAGAAAALLGVRSRRHSF